MRHVVEGGGQPGDLGRLGGEQDDGAVGQVRLGDPAKPSRQQDALGVAVVLVRRGDDTAAAGVGGEERGTRTRSRSAPASSGTRAARAPRSP
ncbi:hypothetical protein F3K40_37720 [Streptomyces sp. LBUM 1478]|nr:hypothetical protein [Streptomyces sp. LBUM 1478]